MRSNVKTANPLRTHEAAPAVQINAEQQLRRSLLSCLLWEKEFYEDGVSIADRIAETAKYVPTEKLMAIADEARNVHGLRHAPLMLLLELVRRGGTGVSDAIANTIRRPDEMAELLSLYWRNRKGREKKIGKQLQRGLAKAFGKFSEYQLAKNDRPGDISIRDVMFLVHPKPKDAEQEALFKRIADKNMATPDTWEVSLSGGADKKETFERLIKDGKLGYLALLRNLRNMVEAGVDLALVKDAIVARKGADLVFPFRYVAAARAAPQLEPSIDQALVKAIEGSEPFVGKTAVLVDVSGSMDANLSGKSDMTRLDAAAALASMINGDLRVFSFSHEVVEVPPRRGMAGVDAVIKSQPHGGTYLGKAVGKLNGMGFDRIIVITDEQSADVVPAPRAKHAYMLNVASYKNGVGYRNGWTHIDGFSEAVLRYIRAIENNQ
jgi:hypothetical protein